MRTVFANHKFNYAYKKNRVVKIKFQSGLFITRRDIVTDTVVEQCLF